MVIVASNSHSHTVLMQIESFGTGKDREAISYFKLEIVSHSERKFGPGFGHGSVPVLAPIANLPSSSLVASLNALID